MLDVMLGKKMGMTQIYDDAGNIHPVTVVQLGPCTVMQVKIAAAAPAPAFNLTALEAAFAHQADGSGVFVTVSLVAVEVGWAFCNVLGGWRSRVVFNSGGVLLLAELTHPKPRQDTINKTNNILAF